MTFSYRFRAATEADVPALIDLMVLSSWGGIRDAWERVTAAGETWRQRGVLELRDTQCEIGYNRFVVAESDAGIAGMILLNMVGETSQMNPAREPPEQMAAVTLIKAARHSLFIREFALAEWARGKGLAQEFLNLVEMLARSNGMPRATLIVNDANVVAYALYRKAGYRQTDQQQCTGHSHFPDSSMLLLLEKSIRSKAS